MQIYNLWKMTESAEKVLEFLSPDLECPHLRLELASDIYSVYVDIENKLADEREKEREIEQRKSDMKRNMGNVANMPAHRRSA